MYNGSDHSSENTPDASNMNTIEFAVARRQSKMSKKTPLIVLICLGIIASALTGYESESRHFSVKKEVYFLNRIPAAIPVYGLDFDISRTGLKHGYDFDEEIDEDALYAYQVEIVGDHKREDVLKLLQEEGFLFITDYQDSSIYIAGKMEDLERVFLRNESYKGYYLGATAILRPDFEQIIIEDMDYPKNWITKEWVEDNFDRIAPYLGTDKNRALVTVTLSTSWEHK